MGESFYVWSLIISVVWISRRGFQHTQFFNAYMFWIAAIKAGDYKRLISSSFLHVDRSHLLFNMMTLFFFGDYIVAYFGGSLLYVIYFGSVVIGGLVSYAYHQHNLNYTAVGASGGVVGVLFAALLAYPDLQVGLLFIPIPMPGYVFILCYAAYTIYGMKSQKDTIGHAAHLGGALGGVLLSWLAAPEILGNWWVYVTG